jgi:PhnB protein
VRRYVFLFSVEEVRLISHTVFSVGSASKHISWIEKALGGKREMIMPDKEDESKIMHAALQLNGGPIYLSDRYGHYGAPDDDAPSTGTHLYLGYDVLTDAERIWKSAVKNKGNVHMPFAAQFWGSHYGVVEDPFGTVWAISAPTPKEEENEEEEEPLVKPKKSSRRKSPSPKKAIEKKKATKRAKK